MVAPSLWRERRFLPLAMLGVGILAHLAMWLGLIACPRMSMTECLAGAAGLVGSLTAVGVLVRAGWLARRTHRAVAGLPRVRPPAPILAAAGRAGVPHLTCLAGDDLTAFCAGLWRSRVYLTAAFATLDPAALEAVLRHEAAHARRRDPLRRLLARATADVLFFLPLAGWWRDAQEQRSELSADRSALAKLGAGPVAAALLSVDTARHPTATAAFDGALDARIAQLTGDQPGIPRPAISLIITSLAGPVLVTSLAMCLAQTWLPS